MDDQENRDPPYSDAAEASRIYLLPNSLTAGNLFFGFLAILRCIQANYTDDASIETAFFRQAVWFILLAVICDALDGRVARLGGRESLFGREFDSLADIVSFGIAPSMMVIFLILQPTENYPFFLNIGWLIAFIYLLCAAVRLARFNVLTHPMLPPAEKLKGTKDFVGLPVPAAAGMIASLVLVLNSYELQAFALSLPALLLAIAALMVSNIRYPSFKEIDWHTQLRFRAFIVLVVALGLIFLFRQFAFAILFLAYIAYGPARYLARLSRIRRHRAARAQSATQADDGPRAP